MPPSVLRPNMLARPLKSLRRRCGEARPRGIAASSKNLGDQTDSATSERRSSAHVRGAHPRSHERIHHGDKCLPATRRASAGSTPTSPRSHTIRIFFTSLCVGEEAGRRCGTNTIERVARLHAARNRHAPFIASAGVWIPTRQRPSSRRRMRLRKRPRSAANSPLASGISLIVPQRRVR